MKRKGVESLVGTEPECFCILLKWLWVRTAWNQHETHPKPVLQVKEQNTASINHIFTDGRSEQLEKRRMKTVKPNLALNSSGKACIAPVRWSWQGQKRKNNRASKSKLILPWYYYNFLQKVANQSWKMALAVPTKLSSTNWDRKNMDKVWQSMKQPCR